MTLDLRKEEGRCIVKRLAARSDVLIENFRPGVMEGWGLGPRVCPAVPAGGWLEICGMPANLTVRGVLLAGSGLCCAGALCRAQGLCWLA